LREENNGKPFQIELKPVQAPSAIKIKKKYDTFKKVGGDPESLTLTIMNKQQETIFKGPLKYAEFLPEDASSFQLSDKNDKYYFKADNVPPSTNELTIDVKPDAKILDAVLTLKHNRIALDKKDKVIFYLLNEPNQFKINNKKEFQLDNLKFLYTYNKGAFSIGNLEMTVCYQSLEPQAVTLKPSEAVNGIINMSLELKPILPEVVIVISGNGNTTKDYWVEGRDAVLKLWNKVKAKGKVFTATEGSLERIDKKRSLETYMEDSVATDYHINEEIKKALSHFNKNNECDETDQKYLVYIGKTETENEISYSGDVTLCIISPDPEPKKWNHLWYQAETETEIGNKLSKILKGQQ